MLQCSNHQRASKHPIDTLNASDVKSVNALIDAAPLLCDLLCQLLELVDGSINLDFDVITRDNVFAKLTLAPQHCIIL
jgi:hypothetical protein